jgi:hypothetical protein
MKALFSGSEKGISTPPALGDGQTCMNTVDSLLYARQACRRGFMQTRQTCPADPNTPLSLQDCFMLCELTQLKPKFCTPDLLR